MFIAYLDPDRYVGVEPNRWLIDQAIPNETGDAMIAIKRPRFDDNHAPAWRYPGCYSYARSAITSAVANAGLAGETIAWYHPRHTWWLLAHHAERLPPAPVRDTPTGPTLASNFPSS